jgi:hypothetical protein
MLHQVLEVFHIKIVLVVIGQHVFEPLKAFVSPLEFVV